MREIAPGSSIRDMLAANAKATFSVSVSAGSLLRFSIDKGDLILSTTLYDPTGAKLLEHVSHDFEVVDLSFPAQATGAYRIELLSREDHEARSFELKLQSLTPFTGVKLKDSEARQALARAEVLRAESTESSFRQAIQPYDEATQIWASLSDFAGASNGSLKSGDQLFDLGEYMQAVKPYQNAVALAERSGDWLAEAKALGRMGRVENIIGNNSQAQQHVDQALALFRLYEANLSATAANGYGEVLSTQAEIDYSKGAFGKARKQLEKALTVFRDDRKGVATAHLWLSYIKGSMGYLEQATDEGLRARELYRAVHYKRGEALALTSLGLANSFRNESEAMEFYRQASEIFRVIGDKTSEAIALNALGQAHENLHDDAALTYYEQALVLFEEKKFKDAQTNSLLKIGTLYFDKDLDKALAYDERCLQLSQQIGDARTGALARTQIARVYTAHKRYALASVEYQKVLHFYESTKDLRAQATALSAYGDFLLQSGAKQKAVDIFERARSLSNTVHDKELHIGALYYLARAHVQLGSPEHALAFIQESLQEIEELRASVESPDFRASYFSGVQQHYKLCIEILMQLEHLHPGQRSLIQAFLKSENSRARLLRELVTEANSRQRGGVSSELLHAERELRARFRALAQYRINLALDERNSAEVADLDRELAQLRTQYQEVEARLTQQNPVLSSLGEPVSFDQIQHDLRDDNTILLEYSLGDERSYLFVVTCNEIYAYELPNRKVIEDAANEYSQLMTARERDQLASDYQAKVEAADRLLPEKGSRLSQMLLGPVADKLGNKRLLIVAEGTLQNLPFAALPVPMGHSNSPTASEDASKMLVQTNEVVIEPSMSTLAMIRKAQNHSSSPAKLVAVIADPVLSHSDERVQNASRSSTTALAAANSNPDESLPQGSAISMRAGALTRLVHASEEADAISAAAPWGTTMIATGFAANRETATSSAVGQYQIIHFATHGVFNGEHPELSGIVLTMVDRNDQNTNGFMPLQDIYSLNLSAELTVLSACQTASGKDIKGEGFVGLTHSFLSAGSKSVVASLWKVDDRATAIFMSEFYKLLLQEGISPAAALRATKLKMMQDKQWSAPYYWAGFVLQGEYENHINVDRYSSIRLPLMLLLVLSLTTAGLVLHRRRKQRFSPPQSS